jgi:AraC-like DNA-binding protein
MPPEQAHFYSRPDVYGIELIHAVYVRHRFARHAHEHYVIGMIERGLQTFSYRGEKHGTASSGIILLNPDEPHTGEAATQAGFTYKALYPTTELMARVLEEGGAYSRQLPFFPSPVIYDPSLSQRLLALHAALVRPQNSLEGESLMLGVLSQLIRHHADIGLPEAPMGQERAAVRRVRHYIQAHYAQNISLAELAQEVAFSPYYLARVFKAEVGVPPHVYLETVRIRQAQRLLAGGYPLGQVALQTGFAHQSHFTNRFKRFVGVSPAQYAKKGKITQEF